MNKFNSNRQVNSNLPLITASNVFNSSKQAKKKKDREPREVSTLYAMRGSDMDGWSQLSTDPGSHGLSEQRRLAEHILFGCQEPIIPGKKHEDGTPVRDCACRGTHKGVDLSQLDHETARIAGIGVDDEGKVHYPGAPCHGQEGCKEKHASSGWFGNEPTLADYQSLMVNIPGQPKPVSVAQLMLNAHSMQIGTDSSGAPIYPGHYRLDEGTGNRKIESAYRLSTSAANSAAMDYHNLIEQGNENVEDWFDVDKRNSQIEFQTKRKELDPSDPNGEEHVRIMKGAPLGDPLHVVMDGTLRNIRRTLGDDALEPTEPHHRQLWDKMATARTTQTFNPHHVLDEQLNPASSVIDVQDCDKLAKSKIPGVAEAYYAARPQDIPGVGSMSEKGSIGKRDTFSRFWRSGAIKDFAHRLIRDHNERNMPNRVDSAPGFRTDYASNIDDDSTEAMLEAMRRTPEKFKNNYQVE